MSTALEFEWDDNKRRENIRKHGVDFLRASLVFKGPVVQFDDDRFDYGEERIVSLGLALGTVYRVVHTARDNRIRIISAQKANRHEQEIYYRSIFDAGN
jgi:uncharacterized protein